MTMTDEDLIGPTGEILEMRRRMNGGGAMISGTATATGTEVIETKSPGLDVTTMKTRTSHVKCDASNTRLTIVIPCRIVATARGRGKGNLSLLGMTDRYPFLTDFFGLRLFYIFMSDERFFDIYIYDEIHDDFLPFDAETNERAV